MPVQLFLLHFRRNHILLIFWFILFATISGNFLKPFGASSLFLAPEYLGSVNALSTAIVGFATGVYIMSWNITTFILYTKHIRFLATTAQPFLKFCINNSALPILFMASYFFFAVQYQKYQEFTNITGIIILSAGFLAGFMLAIFIAFIYFFRADKTIYRRMEPHITSANKKYERSVKRKPLENGKSEVRIDWFLSATLGLRKPRNIKHYTEEFLESIFKRHHFAAVLAIIVAFLFLIGTGMFSDNAVFQVPAAASATVLMAVLIAVAGAFTLFLRTWTIPVLIVLYIAFDWMYENNIIDPRNKAYGLNYLNEQERPFYEKDSVVKLASTDNIAQDKNYYLQILNNWKRKLGEEKPVMLIIDASGGGTRNATFTMNVLQRLDSVTNGQLMPHVFLINGSSGGMIGAAYFRELYWEKINGGNMYLQDKNYVDNISKDLLNPLFSTFISRDLIGPVQKVDINGYRYSKDRGYAFEQKLNENTKGILNKKIGDYKTAEKNADIPSVFFNSVISRDGRKMIISTHPVRFLMQPVKEENNFPANTPDAVDFTSFFQNQNPLNLRMLSALRMNATFPYVLPNVWLPTEPVIDVMDAGLRDNFGQETSLRFLNVFSDWLKANTGKVVLIQIRDKPVGDWGHPYEGNSIIGSFTRPFLLLQHNWYKLQDYYQTDQLNYMLSAYGPQCYRICFQYFPRKADIIASLSFHLTASEKADIAAALDNSDNVQAFNTLLELMEKNE